MLIIFPANCVGFQALIQYQSRQSAVSAINSLQVSLGLEFGTWG